MDNALRQLSQMEAHKTTPIISVVMPVFNAERFVEDAINSILNQSLKDFELILINDGSTDNSLSIMSGLAAQDSRIKLISRENKGLVHSLNEGIKIAAGHWIARMDSDDISHEDRLRSQLQFAIETNSDICGAWVETFGSVSKRLIKHATTDQAIKFELLFDCPFAHPTILIKAEIAKNNPYSESFTSCEDYDLWERLAKINCRMSNIPKVLLKYRVHPRQVSSMHTHNQQKLSQIIRHRYWFNFLQKHHIASLNLSDVINLREPSAPKVDMDRADELFERVLAIADKESKEVILLNIKKLYFRAVSFCPNVALRWKNLQIKHDAKIDWVSVFSLYLLSKLKLGSSNNFYNILKKTYLYLSR